MAESHLSRPAATGVCLRILRLCGYAASAFRSTPVLSKAGLSEFGPLPEDGVPLNSAGPAVGIDRCD